MKTRLLHLLAIEERPDPPPGTPGSVTTFRASRRYFYYSILGWAGKQAGALLALLASLAFFGTIEQPWVRAQGWEGLMELLDGAYSIGLLGLRIEASTLFLLFELLAVGGFVAQLLFTGALLGLSWQLRWYMVGKQALRVREGVWHLREQTMTSANIQTMQVRQGPLQRLFGIADLEVYAAGGGTKTESSEGTDKSEGLHRITFRGLEDAEGLRDRLRRELIRHADAGLGDTDDDLPPADVQPSPPSPASDSTLANTARELLSEVRALRTALRSARRSDPA